MAVIAGFITAVWLRRTRDVTTTEAWAWPMALALLASPVIYPWYLIWLIPFTAARQTIPVWVWSVSVLAVYPTWHLRTFGGTFDVPVALLLVQFALPAAGAVLLAARSMPLTAGRTAHG
jgi:hypothetical protein